MSGVGAIPVVRGCGTRKKGGVYAECGLSVNGVPIEAFLLDPIVYSDIHSMGLAPRAQLLKPVKQSWMLFDYIGEESYPNPTDWIEEVRRFGMSQRVELSAQQYKVIGPSSKLIAIHSRAYYDYDESGIDGLDLLPMHHLGYQWEFCPKEHPYVPKSMKMAWPHDLPYVNCPGFLYQMVIKGETRLIETGEVEVLMPSFNYRARYNQDFYARSHTVKCGAFIAMPIERWVVIHDPEDHTHEKKLKKLVDSQLPVEVSDE